MTLTPEEVAAVQRLGLGCLVEAGAGLGALHPDAAYREAGAEVVSREELRERADVIFQLRPETWPEPRPGTVLLGLPGAHPGVEAFSLDRLPRITRAQSMDLLSAQATVAGYRAALLAAERCRRFFPMLRTAAGTMPPARVLVLGAGVAGLMAMATARRLGAVVTGYDIRPAAQEEIRSVGARVLAPPVLAEAGGGYAAEQPEEVLRRQREGLAETVARAHVLIGTAGVPGRKAPVLVTREMHSGAVSVDLCGNIEGASLSVGIRELAAQLPIPGSQMAARNLLAFLALLVREGELVVPREDELVAACRLP